MESIEIRQNKKTLIPVLVIMTISLILVVYVAFFSGEFKNNKTMTFFYVFAIVSLAYGIFIPVRKFLKDEPVLTLNKSEIEINVKGKPVSFLWLQVHDWKIEKKDNNSYLIIETSETKKKVDISWLEKTPSEIEELMQTFKTK